MMIYLIDTENVSLRKLLENISPKKKDTVIFFYSGYCPSMPIELLNHMETEKVKTAYMEVFVGKQNALDFQLVSYLGYMLRFSGKRKEICIVSNDKAFECVERFWNAQGFTITTIQPPEEKLEENRARQKMISIQKQDLSSKLFTNIRANKERWAVVNFVLDSRHTKTDINKYLTQRFDGKTLRNINNIIKPYLTDRVG